MTINVTPRQILYAALVLGVLLGLAIGSFTVARPSQTQAMPGSVATMKASQSDTTESALKSLRNTNRQIVTQLAALNGRVANSNSSLREVIAQMNYEFETLTEYFYDPVESDLGDMTSDIDAIEAHTRYVDIDADYTNSILENIDSSTFGTCLVLADNNDLCD